MINVLIADDNIKYAISLMNYINMMNKNVRICNIADNGRKALEILNNNNVDVTILDLKMPGYTGNEVLSAIHEKEKYLDSFIIISGEISYINNLSNTELIHTVLHKTTDMKTILEYVNEILEIKNKVRTEKDIKKRIISELLYLNYDLSHKGTVYLIETINCIMKTSTKEFNNLKGEIYPIIAKKYSDSVHNVKCCITRSTQNMYFNCEAEKMKEYFCYDSDYKPNVRTVIRTIINKIEMNS